VAENNDYDVSRLAELVGRHFPCNEEICHQVGLFPYKNTWDVLVFTEGCQEFSFAEFTADTPRAAIEAALKDSEPEESE